VEKIRNYFVEAKAVLADFVDGKITAMEKELKMQELYNRFLRNN
jgi:hypothetical protein